MLFFEFIFYIMQRCCSAWSPYRRLVILVFFCYVQNRLKGVQFLPKLVMLTSTKLSCFLFTSFSGGSCFAKRPMYYRQYTCMMLDYLLENLYCAYTGMYVCTVWSAVSAYRVLIGYSVIYRCTLIFLSTQERDSMEKRLYSDILDIYIFVVRFLIFEQHLAEPLLGEIFTNLNCTDGLLKQYTNILDITILCISFP